MKQPSFTPADAVETPDRTIGWRTFWFNLEDYETQEGIFCSAGSIQAGSLLHPTKESADSAALSWLHKWGHLGKAEYLGAFEVSA
jgi:hypothetical protein